MKILITGVFDLFHEGHKDILKKYKNDEIYVAVINHQGVRQKQKKAIWTEQERFLNIKKLPYVNKVLYTTGTAPDYINLCKKYQIDKMLFGKEWEGKEKTIQLQKHKIDIEFIERKREISTTQLKKMIFPKGQQLTKNYLIKMFWTVNSEFQRNNIKWYAHAGTLLGAIKYNKMIPWDDDIDMLMTNHDIVKNFEKINKILEKHDLKLVNMMETNLRKPYYKITYMSNRIVVDDWIIEPEIDIMIMFPSNKPLTGKEAKLDNRISRYSNVIASFDGYRNFIKRSNFLVKIINYPLWFITSQLLFVNSKVKRINKLMQDTRESNNYRRIDWQGRKHILMSFKRNRKVFFDNLQLNVMDDVETYLKQFYGKNIDEVPSIKKIMRKQQLHHKYKKLK